VIPLATLLFILSSNSLKIQATLGARRATEVYMSKIIEALFGCGHRHCTFPRTAKKPGTITTTYIVCLDCGKEFPYDWQEMKLVASVTNKQREAA
jgi:hypothetical protein